MVSLLVLGAGGAWFALGNAQDASRPPESMEIAVPAVPAPIPAPIPAPVEADAVELSAQFEFHRTVPATGTGFYVLGVVRNESAVAIAKPKLIIVFVDAEDEEVGTAQGFALDDVVEPGASSYLSAIVSDPPKHDRLRFEVIPRRVSFGPKPARGLRVEAKEPRIDGSGIRHFWGTVHNGGPDPASFVRIDVLSFDADDKLLGVHFNYADGELVPPGGSARFEVSAVVHGDPARFAYQSTGMVR